MDGWVNGVLAMPQQFGNANFRGWMEGVINGWIDGWVDGLFARQGIFHIKRITF